MRKIKKTSKFNKDCYYIGCCSKYFEDTRLIIDTGHQSYYDFKENYYIPADSLRYLEPLTDYELIDEEQISIKTALEISSKYFRAFVFKNDGKPARWEPKVKIGEAVEHLVLTNRVLPKDNDVKNQIIEHYKLTHSISEDTKISDGM